MVCKECLNVRPTHKECIEEMKRSLIQKVIKSKLLTNGYTGDDLTEEIYTEYKASLTDDMTVQQVRKTLFNIIDDKSKVNNNI